MKIKNILFLFSLLITIQAVAFSQNGTIKGFIYDNDNGESVAYCTVQLQGTQYGALTEKNGSFIINRIPEGTYVLVTTLFGYSSIIDTIVVGRGTITKRYMLKTATTKLGEFEITADGQRRIQETRTSVISITPKDMSKMPSIGGQQIGRASCRERV